jgi:hypothetical protein
MSTKETTERHGEVVLSAADVEAVNALLAREARRVVSIHATSDSRINEFVRRWEALK